MMACNSGIKSRILLSAPWALALYYLQAAALEIQLAHMRLYTRSSKKEVFNSEKRYDKWKENYNKYTSLKGNKKKKKKKNPMRIKTEFPKILRVK